MKTCIKCKKEQPLSQYHNDKSKKDGKVGACKSCKAAYISIYYKNNSDKMKENSSRNYYKNRDENISRAKDNYLENREDHRKKKGSVLVSTRR